MLVVADHILFRIARVDCRFEYLYFLTCKFCPFHASYQLFCLS